MGLRKMVKIEIDEDRYKKLKKCIERTNLNCPFDEAVNIFLDETINELRYIYR